MNFKNLFVILACPLLHAQELKNTEIEELVVFGNRIQLPIAASSRNIQVITKEQIKKLPARSISEILSFVAGVDIRQRGPFGTQADVSLDGGSFEQTLILLNGIKISDAQTAHNTLNLPLPTELIDRIEILRGPAARIYGINSLTGAINIVTKNPQENFVFAHAFSGTNYKTPEHETTATAYHNYGVQMGGGLVKETHQHQLYGSLEQGNGYRFNTGFDNVKLLYQGNVDFDTKNSLYLLGSWAQSDFGAHGFYAAPGDKDAQEIVATTLVHLGTKHQVSERLTLNSKIGYRYGYDDYRYFKHRLDVARSQHYSNVFTAEANAALKTAVGDFGLGLEHQQQQINSSNIGDHHRSNTGMYAEYKNLYFNKLDVNIGAYINYNSDFGWQVFPGFDLNYSFSDSFSVLANAGSSTRIPSFTDLYLDQRPGNIGNPNLHQEKSFQWEGGFKYSLHKTNVKVIYFNRAISNFIDWTRAESTVPFQAQNFADNKVQGLTVNWNQGLKTTGPNQWRWQASYTYLNSEMSNLEAGILSKYTVNNLRHQIITTLSYSHHKGWSVLFANRYNDRASYKDYFLMDLRVSKQFKSIQVYADGQNLLNQRFIEAGAFPMPGLWTTIGIKVLL